MESSKLAFLFFVLVLLTSVIGLISISSDLTGKATSELDVGGDVGEFLEPGEEATQQQQTIPIQSVTNSITPTLKKSQKQLTAIPAKHRAQRGHSSSKGLTMQGSCSCPSLCGGGLDSCGNPCPFKSWGTWCKRGEGQNAQYSGVCDGKGKCIRAPTQKFSK